MAPDTAALNALGHAVSGSAGTAISTAVLYPLDLVNTRLKAQGRSRSSSDEEKPLPNAEDGAVHYDGVLDAFRSIVSKEGGIVALYRGLGPDVAKSVVDSFLFFGFYNYLQGTARTQRGRAPRILEELGIGALAGAFARLVTTPVSNAVARKQIGRGGEEASLRYVLRAIWRESGWLGSWSGYSATLVLTLNPSITFFLNGRLASRIIPALEEDVPVAWVAFLLAASSKAMATTITYPFQTGKTRLQLACRGEQETSRLENSVTKRNENSLSYLMMRLLQLLDQSIFGVILRIIKKESVRALYDGLQGEVLKSFFSHGLTMLTKGLLYRLVVRSWLLLASRLPRQKLLALPK